MMLLKGSVIRGDKADLEAPPLLLPSACVPSRISSGYDPHWLALFLIVPPALTSDTEHHIKGICCSTNGSLECILKDF